jgi:hypothetical protein
MDESNDQDVAEGKYWITKGQNPYHLSSYIKNIRFKTSL